MPIPNLNLGLESGADHGSEPKEAFVFPPSHAQARLWFLDQYIAEPAVYNIHSALRLTGLLRTTALNDSLRRIHLRHESLRTTFRWVDSQPQQIIAADAATDLVLLDLEAVPEAEQEARALDLLSREAARPFNLATGPLLRSTLIRLSPQSHLLLLCMHHIISDGWSMAVLLKELKVGYRAACLGEEPQFPFLPLQYADFSQWQRQTLQGPALQRHLAYWQQQLQDAPPLLDLPTDRSRPPVLSHRGAREAITLPPTLAAALKTLARTHGATLFMALLGGFQILLARYCGQGDIVVGSPIAGRMRAEVEHLIGFFVNTLALRTDLSGDPTVQEVLARVRATALGAFEHQDLPFERLVEELNPLRSRSHSPLFQVMFVLQNNLPTEVSFLDLKEERVSLENRFSMFDLGLSMWESERGLEALLEYSTDLFNTGTIQRMLAHFRRLLEGMCSDPGQRISRLPLLTDSERQQILVEWNDTACEVPDRPVHALFEEQAKRSPEATAVVLGPSSLSYRALNERSNQIAHILLERGLGPGALVGVLMDRSLELIAGILGILKAGGAYVPLNPTHPKEQLAFILEDTQARFLLTQGHLLERIPNCDATVFRLDLERLAESPVRTSNPASRSGAGDLAYVMYTSGSTGRPKGAEILHRGIVRLVIGGGYAHLDASTRTLQAASVSFDAATFEIWAPLLNGGQCILYPETRLSPATLHSVLERHGINTLWLTSALFDSIIHYAPDCLRGVQQLLVGGEALSLRHVRQALALLPETRIINGYGPTEATTFSCCYPIPASLDEGLRSIPIGRPIGNSTAYILDPQGQPVPVGVAGELHVGGWGLARGYLNRPELTAAAFIKHPFDPQPGARLYKTGDIARHLPDGTIEFLGRRDNQVKIRGHRIELGEIEAALARYPGVSRSVVDLREDPAGGKRIVAYLEAPQREDLAFNFEGLGDFLRRTLPPYMVPDAFAIVNPLPMRNDKLDRRRLQEIPLSRTTPRRHIGPTNPTQILISQIWEELLGTPQVGILDDFFDLGGHSLLAFAMLARVEEVFGRKLPIASLYANATVQALSCLVTDAVAETNESPLGLVQAGHGKRPFFFLHGDFNGGGFYCRNLAKHLDPDQPFYVIHPFGLAGQPAPTRVEDMAAAHRQLLQSVQPEGPYLLGGYCNGALEVYEMAQQLHAAGQKVDLLLLIDPPAPNQEQLLAPPGESLQPDPTTLPQDQRQLLLARLFLRAMANYCPRPYPGPVSLFRSGIQDRPSATPNPNWNRLIPKIERFNFKSAHLTAITRDVAEIGKQIQLCLDVAHLA